jgi:hypothetical protein
MTQSKLHDIILKTVSAITYYWLINVLLLAFVPLCWLGLISSRVMKLDFISTLSSKPTLPFAGLQYVQQR